MPTFEPRASLPTRVLAITALALTALTAFGSAAHAAPDERCGPPMSRGGDTSVGGDRGDFCYPSEGDGHRHPRPDRGDRAGQGDEPPSDDSSDHAVCHPGRVCAVDPPAGADSRFRVEASGGDQQAELFGATNGGSRPDCPDYAEQNSDWLQFGFTKPASGAAWSKVVSMTERQTTEQGAAMQRRDVLQICFAAPYSFATRDGYGLGRDGSDYVGVLPDCSGSGGPCLARREVVRAGDGYTVRLTFRIPANALDPKALG